MCCKMTHSQLHCWDAFNTKMSVHTVLFNHHTKSRPEQILQHMPKDTKTQHTNDHKSYIYVQCTEKSLTKKNTPQNKNMYEKTKQ
jgi:hypothetical protein